MEELNKESIDDIKKKPVIIEKIHLCTYCRTCSLVEVKPHEFVCMKCKRSISFMGAMDAEK